MILIGYIRVSGEAQRNNLSLPVQRDAIVQWCKDRGHFLLDCYEDVESAENASDRAGLQQALNNIFESKADGLVVYKYDRFCRNVLDSEHLKKRFKKADKHLYSVVDQVDWETDDGEMLFQFKSVFAEYERKQIYKRCRAGYERKAMSGGYASGSPPFGYEAMRGNLVKNELEFQAMAAIIDLRAKGVPYTAIAKYLNDNNIKTKRGKTWTSGALRIIYHRRVMNKTKLLELGA